MFIVLSFGLLHSHMKEVREGMDSLWGRVINESSTQGLPEDAHPLLKLTADPKCHVTPSTFPMTYFHFAKHFQQVPSHCIFTISFHGRDFSTPSPPACQHSSHSADRALLQLPSSSEAKAEAPTMACQACDGEKP